MGPPGGSHATDAPEYQAKVIRNRAVSRELQSPHFGKSGLAEDWWEGGQMTQQGNLSGCAVPAPR